MRFPALQQNLRGILTCEMEKVCREEAFLKDEPNRLEVALRRCKKLTGTLVTLKRYIFQKRCLCRHMEQLKNLVDHTFTRG